jgi:DNA-binding MarR family transcriptional regulator
MNASGTGNTSATEFPSLDFVGRMAEALVMLESFLKDAKVLPEDLNLDGALILSRMVRVGGPVSPGDLRRRAYYAGSNVSYNLRRLEEEHFITKKRKRSDARSVELEITNKGSQAGNAVADVIDYLEDRVGMHFSQDAFHELRHFLTNMIGLTVDIADWKRRRDEDETHRRPTSARKAARV